MTADIEALVEKLEEDGKAIISSFAGDGDMYDHLFKSADALRSQAERIQALEAKCAELSIALTAMADEFVKVCPVYYYTEPWAHDRNAVLKSARDVIAAQAGSKEGGK